MMNDNINERKESIWIFVSDELPELVKNEIERQKKINFVAEFDSQPYRTICENWFAEYGDAYCTDEFLEDRTEDEITDLEDLCKYMRNNIEEVVLSVADTILEEEPPEEGLW